MESVCSPYSEPGSDKLKSFCFVQFDLGFIPSLILTIFLFCSQIFFQKKTARQVSTKITLIILVPVLVYFIQITLLLFYKEIDQVSLAEFLNYTINVVLWLVVLYCYQFTFNTRRLMMTNSRMVRLVLVLRSLWSILEFVLNWVNFKEEFDIGKGRKASQEPALAYFFNAVLLSVVFSCGFLVKASLAGMKKSKYVELVDRAEVKKENSTVYERATIFSKLVTWWVYPLLKLGNSRILNEEDIEKVGIHETTAYQKKKMTPFINKFLANKQDKRALLKAVYLRFNWEIAGLIIVGFLANLMDFSGAIFIKIVETYLESDDPLWRGYAIVFYMLLSKLIQAVANNHYRFMTSLLSLHIKSGLSSHIFDKTLTISPSILNSNSSDFSYAQIVNLMQVDLSTIAESVPYTVRALIWPFQFSVGIYLIFLTLGWKSLISGLTIMIILFLFNGLIAKKMAALRKQVMIQKDKRMKILNEWLSSMKVLKLYNWEKKISEKVTNARKAEVQLLTSGLRYMIGTIFLNWGTRNYLIMAVLITMTMSGTKLTPGNVFAGTSVISTLNMAIRFIPDILSNFVQALVSYKRIQDFLLCKDIVNYVQKENYKYAVDVNNASFSWESPKELKTGELQETKTILKDISFKVYHGELVAIVGKVGSGKSSIIHALIENMHFMKTSETSHVTVSGQVAYVSQEAWIQNTTIKKNIFFGAAENQDRYEQVIKVCQLSSDLEILPAGDQTEIGEKGINLSGGQKTRVAIARAVYSDADIYLLDDPLSAVDAHVGDAIFNQCFKSFLSGKTVLLVTNNQQFLPYVDKIIMVKDGKISEMGSYEELIAIDGIFKNEFLVEISSKQEKSEKKEEKNEEGEKKDFNEKKIIEVEDRASGGVNKSVYKTYINYSGGTWMLFLVVFFMLCWQADRMYTDLFLSEWTEQSYKEQQDNRVKNILIYSLASFSVNLFILFRLIVTVTGGLNASKKIFTNMISALVDAPINTFYDVTPTGRILNRLSKDQNIIDTMLIFSLNGYIGQVFQVFCIVCLIGYIVPYLLIGVPVALYLAIKIQSFYLASSCELIRMEGITRSPIVQNFSETVYGISTVRAFGYQSIFSGKNNELVDINSRYSFYQQACNCWLGIALEVVSDIFLVGSSLVIVSGRDNMGPALASLCLSYAITLPENIYFLVLSSAMLETNMVSVERCHQLSQILPEGSRLRHKDQELIKRSWPVKGKIEFDQYQMKYREDTEIVLRGVTGIIKNNEKIGIVGRTGSGKSSICLALFRIIEPHYGHILIDGVDIEEIGLDLLRQKICVIPQEPVLFQATLRENLDPFGDASQERLEEVLRHVQVFQDSEIKGLLDKEVKEGGSNFSAGQRQLICIARALLRNSKIIFLDEATASIDYKTDALIQEVIKKEFKDCTVLTIAHRINTIMEYDRVIVMDKGVIAEFGSPQELIEKNGIFAGLVKKHSST